jgi:single stranded DNA-binding protein
MPVHFNQILIGGFAGHDAEVKQAGASTVVRLRIGASEWKKKIGSTELDQHTEWVNVEVWGFGTEKAGKVKKGDNVVILGKLRQQKYKTKDGTEKLDTKILATTVQWAKTAAADQTTNKGADSNENEEIEF